MSEAAVVVRPAPNPFARKQPWVFRGKGPNGRNLCFCGCAREVVRPRISCYSDECLTWYKRHNDPGTIRSIVEDRDKGICALCRKDCEQERTIARETERLWRWLALREANRLADLGQLQLFEWQHEGDHPAPYMWANRWVAEDIKACGWDFRGHTWEADHIIPVIEGGGGCGPEGYRTLCLACHKKQTADLAARRAVKRKSEKAKGALALESVAPQVASCTRATVQP